MIKTFRENNKIIATICVAALPLAKTGALLGKNGTTYNRPDRRDTLKSLGVNVLDQPIALAGNMITSYNPSSSIGVALLFLELLTSKENSNKIRELIGF